MVLIKRRLDHIITIHISSYTVNKNNITKANTTHLFNTETVYIDKPIIKCIVGLLDSGFGVHTTRHLGSRYGTVYGGGRAMPFNVQKHFPLLCDLYIPSGSIEIAHTSQYSHCTGKSELCIPACHPLFMEQSSSNIIVLWLT